MDFVPFPRFSSENLSVWFAQVESTFALNGILSESDKYDYVVTQIPLDYTTMVEDILLNPPPENKYGHLKYEFIKRMSVYQLKKEELGNSKPSEYLYRLKEVADHRVSTELILNVWLTNLPKKVRDIVSLETTGHVETLCQMADRVMALVTTTPPPQPAGELSGEQFKIISQRIDELSKQVRIVQLMIDGEDGQQQSSNKKCSVATVGGSKEEAFKVFKMCANDASKVICWYHTIFGDKAVACVSPCQYKCSPTEYFLRP